MGGAALAALVVGWIYLAAFALGTGLAAYRTGQRIWLFGRAQGRARLAAAGFRLAFALALLGPILLWAFPVLSGADPFWGNGAGALGLFGPGFAVCSAGLALVAQWGMGGSWRVGVGAGDTGPLVTDGLFRFSRNPTFLGQFALLFGLAMAAPSLPGVIGTVLFFGAASLQIREEEAVLCRQWGARYEDWAARVPRWLGVPRRT